MDLSVFGLGKLGAPLAAVLASKGHQVIGYDPVPAVVAAVESGRAPVDETGLQALMDRSSARIAATHDAAEAVRRSAITYVIVPTPSDAGGSFTNHYVLDAVERIGRALRTKVAYHVVVVTSTVMPGSMDGPIREALERTSGRTVGADVGLCYSPEFIALGSVVHDMLNPDVVLIGE